MDEKLLYATVVVDLPLLEKEKEFDYRIPDRLRARLGIGSVVVVPFARAKRVGYVTGISETTSIDAEKVLAVDDLIEDEPVFDARMVKLARWISDKYLATMVESIKLALQPGRTRKLSQVVVVSETFEGERSPARRAIMDHLLARGGSESMANLNALFGGGVAAKISAMVDLGAVVKRYVLERPVVEEKTERYAKPVPGRKPDIAFLLRAPKQRAIYEILASEGEKAVSELLLRADATSTQLKSLATKGLVTFEERRAERLPAALFVEKDKKLVLTDEQGAALAAIETSIESAGQDVFLLQGVTGSGKTEVYLRAIRRALDMGGSAIVLVPEIALTAQMVARFKARFGELVAVLHSGLSDGERYDQWRGMKEGGYRVVVGARSAIFAPLKDVRVVIVDEEHEGAYKQGRSPRYQARDVAIELGRLAGAAVVLGSATPSLESRHKADEGVYRLLVLACRVNDGRLPEIELVDMRREPPRKGTKRTISDLLEARIREALGRGEKVILLLNRRGFSNYLLCPDCGFVPVCPRCAVSLNYHRVDHRLKCHHCGFLEAAPNRCPKCRRYRLFYKGAGTQRAEEEVASLFPDAPIVRMDADTTGRKNAHQAHLVSFQRERRGAILLGTQMIAKGLDFPEVTLVGVLDADTALYLPDFRATERTFQLLMQVSGRAGRGERPGRVVVQTYSPDSGAIRAVLRGDYDEFYMEECAARNELDYPPFTTMIRLLYAGPDAGRAMAAAEKAAKLLSDCPGELLGPAPAPLVRIKGDYRYHLVIKAKDADESRAFIRENLRALYPAGDNGLSLTVDVDPLWVL